MTTTTEITFTSKTTGATLGIFIGAQFNTAMPHLVEIDAAMLKFLTTPVKSKISGLEMNDGFEIGRNVDTSVVTLCGREITKADFIASAIADRGADTVCKACAKRAAVNV